MVGILPGEVLPNMCQKGKVPPIVLRRWTETPPPTTVKKRKDPLKLKSRKDFGMKEKTVVLKKSDWYM